MPRTLLYAMCSARFGMTSAATPLDVRLTCGDGDDGRGPPDHVPARPNPGRP